MSEIFLLYISAMLILKEIKVQGNKLRLIIYVFYSIIIMNSK